MNEFFGYGIILAAFIGGIFNIAYGIRDFKNPLHCYLFAKGIAVFYFSVAYTAIMFNLFGLDAPAVGRAFIRPAILTLLLFILTDIWLRRKTA